MKGKLGRPRKPKGSAKVERHKESVRKAAAKYYHNNKNKVLAKAKKKK